MTYIHDLINEQERSRNDIQFIFNELRAENDKLKSQLKASRKTCNSYKKLNKILKQKLNSVAVILNHWETTTKPITKPQACEKLRRVLSD